METEKIQLCRLLDKAPPFETSPAYSEGISHTMHSVRNVKDRAAKYSNRSSIEGSAQKQSTCEGVIVWAVNRYIQRYQLTARPLSSTHLCAVLWLMMRRASHFSIIKILRKFDNRRSSSWLYTFSKIYHIGNLNDSLNKRNNMEHIHNSYFRIFCNYCLLRLLGVWFGMTLTVEKNSQCLTTDT